MDANVMDFFNPFKSTDYGTFYMSKSNASNHIIKNIVWLFVVTNHDDETHFGMICEIVSMMLFLFFKNDFK